MKSFRRLFKYLRPFYKPLTFANICMLLAVLFNLLSLLTFLPFVDFLFNTNKVENRQPTSIFDIKDIITNKFGSILLKYDKTEVLMYLCLIIFVTFALKNLFTYFQSYFMSTVEQGILRDLRSDLYNKYLKLPLSFFTEERKGNLISRIINDVQITKDSLIAVINSIFRDPPQIISYVVILFLFNWKMTLIIFLIAPLTSFILSKIGDSLKRSSTKSQEKVSDITSILDETIGGIRIVKAFDMEDYESERFRKENHNYFKILTRLERKRSLGSPISEQIGVIVIVVILFIVGRDIIVDKSDMTPGSFIAYLAIFSQLLPSLKLAGQVSNSIKEGSAASDRIFKLLDTDIKISNVPNAVVMKSFENNIVFSKVSFKYEKSETILDDISLTINKGEILAIVGPSGAGKSTLADLIPRFYDVTSGSIVIDGIDIKKINTGSLRKLMGIVTQETLLFNDTIRNNIAYGEAALPLEKIIEAAKAANAHNFIISFENGYDSVIGDRGVKLSGGERQRLSIARALLKNPPILILDEATSSLDTQSELLVQEAIERLMQGRTSIVIAHRLSTIKNADKIIVLEKGRLVQEGKHSELLSAGGLYEKLYNIQFLRTSYDT
ncbi:ABC transporter ATP-binding protein [soil metagenome]